MSSVSAESLVSGSMVVAPQMSAFASKTMVSEQAIHARLKAIAVEVGKFFHGKITHANPLLVVSILKGSYILAADFSRALFDANVPNEVEFVCVSSYGAGTSTSGEVRMLLDLRTSLIRRHVLLIDDIIDSARTVDFIVKVFSTRSPASLSTFCLLDKPSGRQLPFVANFTGFTIPNDFVVGYGLDFNQRFRDGRDIVVLKKECYSKL